MKGKLLYPYQRDFHCLSNVPSHGKGCVRMKRDFFAPLVAPFWRNSYRTDFGWTQVFGHVSLDYEKEGKTEEVSTYTCARSV